MKAITVLLLACAACEERVEMYPISPGGGGGGGTTFVDAAVDGQGGDGGATLSGRVCLINDARAPTTCATTGAAGFTVGLGPNTAMTVADGGFNIAVPTGTGLVWRVSGTGITPSAMPATNGTQIPALDAAIYQNMLTTNLAASGNNTGAIIAQLKANGAAVTNARATTTPAPTGAIFYDGGSFAQWDTDATGTFGVVWVPGLAVGTATMQVMSTGTAAISGIPVYADTITYVFAAL